MKKFLLTLILLTAVQPDVLLWQQKFLEERLENIALRIYILKRDYSDTQKVLENVNDLLLQMEEGSEKIEPNFFRENTKMEKSFRPKNVDKPE